MKAFARSPRRVPTRDADHCDYPDCEQHWTMVLDRALAAMTKFHATFAPDEEDADLTPRTTSEAFREFVDEHARLLNIRATAPPPPRDAIAPSAAQPAVSAPSHEGAGEATGGAVSPTALAGAPTYVCGDHAGIRLEIYFETRDQAEAAKRYVDSLKPRIHTTIEDFDHFLFYSDLQPTPALKWAFFAGRGENVPERCEFVGMYDIQCGLNSGHVGEHKIYGPHHPGGTIDDCGTPLKSGEQA